MLHRILPAFGLIAFGLLLARIRPLTERTTRRLADAVMKISLPVFVALSVAGSPLDLALAARVVAAASIVVAGGALVVLLSARAASRSARGVVLPVMLMNCGNLGIAVNRLQYGPEGESAAVLFYVTTSLLALTLGVALVARSSPLSEIARLPLLYAFGAGLLLRAWGVAPHPYFASLAALCTIPPMLFLLGHDVGRTPPDGLARGAAVGGVRILLGGVLGLCAVRLLALEGTPARVVLVESTMPSAVMSFLLARKYDASPEIAGAAVVATTLAAPVTVTLVITLLGG